MFDDTELDKDLEEEDVPGEKVSLEDEPLDPNEALDEEEDEDELDGFTQEEESL